MKNSKTGNQKNQQGTNRGEKSNYQKPANRQDGASRPSNNNQANVKTSTIDIDDTFTGPVEVDGWRVSINHQNRIVCTPIDPAIKEIARHRTFTNEPGILTIRTVNGDSYAFFRSTEFQAFLTECGNPHIINADPNGEYHSIHGSTRDSIYNAAIVCDGTATVLDHPSDKTPVVTSRTTNSGGVPNNFYVVENAKIAIFDKIKFDANTLEPTVYRSIITQLNVNDIADTVREMIKQNAAAIEKMQLKYRMG